MALQYRPYGKLIARVNKNSKGSDYGIMDRTLEIYQLKTGLKGILYRSDEFGWRKANNVISVCKFTESTEGERPSIQRVKEYFGFGNRQETLVFD